MHDHDHDHTSDHPRHPAVHDGGPEQPHDGPPGPPGHRTMAKLVVLALVAAVAMFTGWSAMGLTGGVGFALALTGGVAVPVWRDGTGSCLGRRHAP